MKQKIKNYLENLLLDTFNSAQEIEGFTVSDDSDEIYRADTVNDGLFQCWLSDCNLREARLYRQITSP